MFRGFIPGKRVSSVDLSHNHELLDEISKAFNGGKENTPKTVVVDGPPSKGVPLGASKLNAEKSKDGKVATVKGRAKASEQAPVTSEDTTQAFDKLLVS